MAQLRRIILLHTHLDGVVEIDVDAHTNFCGTNASGKTTLQRLIPVFYGEQPNRVVPKTRKKFDEFYLPYNNSYIIYEYQRDNGAICQAVLTRKSDGGVEYRFVGSAYQSEHYLTRSDTGVSAYRYPQWASAMRAHPDIQVSPKISATSEYRSIIQNDVATLGGSNSDSMKLRRLAASFALVGHNHKLRHIEKLVSAVHAKEGKMDTLKSMLAAIFEEDGVTLPTTKVKNTKAREWIAQMRQSMRLEKLETDFANLSQLATQLKGTDAQLAALLPQLESDRSQQQTIQADAQDQLQQVRDEWAQVREQFSLKQNECNGQLSKAEADLDEKEHRLDQLQKRYDEFESGDMAKLQRDVDALPLWRENLQELVEQHALMVEQHSDLERQLEQRKAKLNDALQRLSEQNRAKSKQLQQQKDATRERQQAKNAQLEQTYQEQLQTLQTQFSEQSATLKSQIAVLEHQQAHLQLNTDELDAMAASERRLEQAQQNYQSASRQLASLQSQHQQTRQQRDAADQALTQARREQNQAEQQLAQLKRQLSPEHGTLRHFLQQHYPQWHQRVGKVIDASLLDRSDLQPDLVEVAESLYGLKLELNAIELSDYAQDDVAVTIALQQAEQHLSVVTQQRQQAEKALKTAHDAAQQCRSQVEQAQWQVSEAEQNIEYAREARDRLSQQQQQLQQQRKSALAEQLQRANNQLKQLEQAQQQQISQLRDDHQQQKLEFQLDWQSELQVYDEQLEALEAQLEEKRASNQAQLKDLEQAFNEELSDMGVDPKRLAQSKQQQQQLHEQIQTVQNRQDELNRYQQFIQFDWQQFRPKLLEEETALKQQLRILHAELNELKTNYTAKRHQLDAQRLQHQTAEEQARQWLDQLTPLLTQLQQLELAPVAAATEIGAGDLSEHLSRASEALSRHNQLRSQLRSAIEQFELLLSKDASSDFLDRLEHEKRQLPEGSPLSLQLKILSELLHILRDQQQQLLEMGENIGGDLKKFFIVFRDINRRIARQSSRLSAAVADDLSLEGIEKSEVKIISTIDELGFWEPLKMFAEAYDDWGNSGRVLPSDEYLNALSDVVELLRADEQYRMESLLRLELHLKEGGSELVIKNDRQLLESSSHGMAYLILCKYLLAFTRLMRGSADLWVHWPIDEIGTLAYHNVEKLFQACSENQIIIVGAFPNPESDVLMLFKHRYLLQPSEQNPNQRQIKRIQPKMSRLAQRLLDATEN
ncbi:ATP-binding protein [Celerinatantimonas diazotrophica]|uniref:Uncharacterized protein DUF3584 n=1 Tax=Celerinatantimonas diazotrophica TaxID=412034 RepID=A0A4R1J7U4_9GAMM|nr:ATP-binding protein [Celerinatantimonas diazotrophica]TCK46421.1 uncharacterized protein DUF3584 [Celerinatantimonas diazotrophica]CAG9295202.1 Chromosome partition protein Smc [Celerinatantimonas diazotrophica]